jgi:hypothetical protein
VVISTADCQICRYDLKPYQKKGDIISIGCNRWYETMAFESLYDEYNDADVTKEIEFDSEWSIWGQTWEEVMEIYDQHPDLAANEMHEKVIEELKEMIKNGNVY